MKRFSIVVVAFVTVALLASACGPAGPHSRPLAMTSSQLTLDWGVTRDQELGCGGDEIAGGSDSGTATWTDLGTVQVHLTAAWDIGNLLDPGATQFTPVGPTGGPVAPVLGQARYPYAFHYDPLTDTCADAVTADGILTLTNGAGDTVQGEVTGGETYRLDFQQPGDGTESFIMIDIVGGTGAFASASGSLVVHDIVQFDFGSGTFVTNLAEVLPGASITY